MSFEIFDRDLLGRIGKIKTKRGIIETPLFLPVVNPLKQSISPQEIQRDYGCQAIITNAYLLKKNFEKVAFCSILLILIASCACSESMLAETDRETDLLSLMIGFYRGPLNHLSAVRSSECPMYPSDSEYSLQSIQKHGILKGYIMTMDRLMRCGRDETKLSPKVFVNGKWKYYDPVENNDFWWSDK